MTAINQELYEALIAAGSPDDLAKRAAASVLSRDDLNHLATKTDIAELKADLILYWLGRGDDWHLRRACKANDPSLTTAGVSFDGCWTT